MAKTILEIAKKSVMTMTLSAVCLLLWSRPVVTSGSENAEIPPRMQPDTVIRYVSEDEYVIEQGGEADGSNYNENGLTEEEQAVVDARNASLLEEYGEMQITRVSDPWPVEGMIVYYDGNGFISKIFNPISLCYTALPRGTTSPNGTYTWGAHENTLIVTSNRVTGKGRITTFSDTIGENDNELVKGDAATRGDYDNPAHNQRISVSIPEASTGEKKVIIMYKRDNGALTDAILDIWKDGVEYWGYTYSTSLSFDDGMYTYSR